MTLIAGYPFPIVTPAHGTAFDIAGKGIADTGATFNALELGRKLALLQPRPAASAAARAEAAWEIAAQTAPELAGE